ncbi:MAG: hypothetical protein KBG48_07240 [Kofleriaceae bacterium]|nr:hypothetical protein [Kofleriaceae bacterium]MBP9167164.1 hypothetical protein [Kofleriaceae bacterium]MBP9861174.1 hypothetical protein [Kofleriaceae bacterium]
MRGWTIVAILALAGCGKKGKEITDARIDDAGVVDALLVDATLVDGPLVDAGLDAPVGHPGTGVVTGAVEAQSPNYKLFGTLRSGDGSSTSPNYQRRGGVTGATQR